MDNANKDKVALDRIESG